MLGQCWTDVVDCGPTLTQHWLNVSCLLESALDITKKNASNLTEDQRLDLENIGLYVIMSTYPVLNIYLQVIIFLVNFPLNKHILVESAECSFYSTFFGRVQILLGE